MDTPACPLASTHTQVLTAPHTHCGRVDTGRHPVRWHSAKALASYNSPSVFNFSVTNLQEVSLSPVYSNRVSLFCLCCPCHYNSLAPGSHIAETKVCTQPCAKLNVRSFKVLNFEGYWDNSVATGTCWQTQYSVSLGPTAVLRLPHMCCDIIIPIHLHTHSHEFKHTINVSFLNYDT